MSYEKLGFTSGQVLKAEHLNHIEDGIANAGGVTSWNDLEDKPFGEEVTEPIVFDGNVEGKVTVLAPTASLLGADLLLVKVSDVAYTAEELSKTMITQHRYLDGEFTEQISPGSQGSFEEVSEATIETNTWLVWSMRTTEFDMGEGLVIQVPTTGLYLAYQDVPNYNGHSIVSYIHKLEFPSVVKTLDEKYLPTLTSPNGKKFKLSVDDSGTISATEVTA